MQQQKRTKKLVLSLVTAVLLTSINISYASFITDIISDVDKVPKIYDKVVDGVKDLGQIVDDAENILKTLVNFDDLKKLLSFRTALMKNVTTLEATAQKNAISKGQILTSTAFTDDPFKNQLSSFANGQTCTSDSCSTNANTLLNKTSLSNPAEGDALLSNISGASVGYQKISLYGNKPTPEAVKYAAFSNSQSAMYSLSASNLSSMVTKRQTQALEDGKTHSSSLELKTAATGTLFGIAGSSKLGLQPIGEAFNGISSAFGQIFQLFYFAQTAVSHLGDIADTAEKGVEVMSSLLNMATMAMQLSVGDQLLQSAEQSMSGNIGKKNASD